MTDKLGVLQREADESTKTGVIVPQPRVPVAVRTATLDDLSFIDDLQKTHSHMVGWFPRKQMEQYIEGEHVLVAEESSVISDQSSVGETDNREPNTDNSPSPLGYCIFKDQYLKRDDVGIIYQLNVLPLKQRNLIGATLVKEAFARAAYGCKLFSCWCAQDIQANWFWESIGFVPLAFRTGSRGKQRIHIFWQRRINQEVRHKNTGGTPPPSLGASTVPPTPVPPSRPTPYWFPYQTQAGAVREDRIVLPIPPETHWRDVMPLLLPEVEDPAKDHRQDACATKTLPGGAPVKPRPEQPKLTAAQRATIVRAQSAHLKGVPVGKKAVVTGSGIKYVDRTDYIPELDDPDELREEAIKTEKKKRARKPRAKHDPKIVKQARELRDRFLEAVNERGLLPEAWDADGGKYDVSRQLPDTGGTPVPPESIRIRPEEVRLLDAA